MAKMCLVPTAGIRSLAEKIRLAYPEACKRNGFSDQMCAEWVGLYNDLNNINNPDNIPSMKSLVNAIEKMRNNEGKSFLMDLSKDSNQENNQLTIIDKAIRTGNWDDEALDELDNLNNDDYGRILKRFSLEELRSSDEVLKQAETIVSRGNGSSGTSNTSSQQERIKQQEIPVEMLEETADAENILRALDSKESSDPDLNKKFGDKTETTVSEILDNLLANNTPFKEFALALRDNIGDIGNILVKLVPHSYPAVHGLGGVYVTHENTIYINRNVDFRGKNGVVDNTVLHEIVHAIVANSLNTQQHREELGKIFDEAREKILNKYNVDSYDQLPEDLKNGKLYGLKNLDEFAAEFFTNSEFISELNDENTFGRRSDKKSIISRLVEWIKSLLPKGVTDTYKRSGEILEDILLNSGGNIQANRSLLAGSNTAATTQQNIPASYEGMITPDANTIFVFGSNPEGRHGAGAAKTAKDKFGAIYGQGEGLQGNSYALPTKDLRVKENKSLRSISPEQITENIRKMYEVARQNPGKQFKVAYTNGLNEATLNGYTGAEMIKMFKDVGSIPSNVIFSKNWTDHWNEVQSSQTKPENLSPIDPRFKQGIETLAGYYEGGGRLLTDDYPGVPNELDDKLNDHFMGGEELSDNDYKELANYISITPNPDANTSQGWPYIAVPKKQSSTQQKQSNKSSFNVSQAEFYSGDAMGSDRAWAREARKLGIKVTDYTVGNWDVLPQVEKDKYDQEYREVANQMGRRILDANSYNGRLVRRDMMQADSADAIFAIGTIDSRGYVDGGTGYATTRGIIRNIPVYVYDRRNKQWKIWSTNSRKFIPIPEPTLTPHAAVIGTRGDVIGKDPRGYDIRDIKEEEKQVIRNILAKTVGQQPQQVQQQLTQQQTTTTPKVQEGEHGDFSYILAQEEAEGRLNPSNEKNLPGTQVLTTPKPLSPSYLTALKVPSSELKDFYTAFSPIQIVDRAKMIKNMFSDIIDETIYERREYYNDILNSSDSSEEEKENAKKSLEVYNDPVLSREAAADFRTYSVIMDEIKESLNTQAEYATDPVTRLKLENTVKFFDLLSNEASKWIEEEEGIRKGREKSSDEEEQDDEDFGDNDEGNASNGNDGWVYKERFNNPFKATSKQVRRILCGIENGQTDDLGNSKTYDLGFIYSALISFLSKNLENADDFMTLVRPQDYTEDMKDSEGNTVTAASYPKGYPTFPAIEKMRIRYPWADQVIARLTNDWRAKDEDDATQLKYPPTYGAVASQFYTNFFKAFIPSAKIQVGVNPETGKPYFGTTPLNYDMEERSQRDALETAYNNGMTYSDDSLYNHDKTLNNENAKKIGKLIDALLLGEKISYLYNAFNENNELGYPIDKEYTDQAEEILNILKAFGINVDKDNVRALILQDENASTLKGMLTDLRGIASLVERLSPEKNYFMDVVNKYGKSIWDDFFAGRGFVTEVNYMQSFYDSASKKTRYSYSADNFIQRTMRMLFSKNVSKERRQKYINDHYGRYEWFRDQSAPEGTGWKMMWLEDAYNGTFESDNLPYININSVDDRSGNTNVVRDYNQWTAADKYRVMLRSWDTGSGDFAYYLAPIFADSPMSLTVKGPKYSRNQLIEGTYDESGKYIPSGFVRLIDQELKRIKYVTETRAKAIREGKILPITNYEKNGRKFNFMPELNEPRFSYNGVDNMTFLEVAQQIERDYEGAAAGAKEEALRNVEIAAITEILNQKYNEFLNNMPLVIIDEVAGKESARIEDIREKLDLAYFNMVYAGVQIVQATVVDIAFSKDAVDFQKRFKQVYASGGRMNTNSLYGQKTDRVILIADEQITSPNYNNIKNIVNKAGKRLSQKDKEYILGCYTFLKDKHLDGINVSDAQALRSLSSMRSILDMYGKWNDLLEAAYHRFQEGTWDRNDFDIILQTLKPFVYSVIGRNSGVDGEQIPVPIQHKNSELVLLAMYDLISGNIRNSERLKGMNRFLETVKDADGNPIANMIQYESGGKSGNQGVVNINYSHSKVMEAVQDGVISLYNSLNRLLEDQIFLDSEFKENTRENTSDNYDTIKNELTQKLVDGKISQETFNRCMRTFEPTADEVVETLTTYATILNEDGTLSVNPERVQEVPFEDYMMAQPTPPHHMDTQAPQGSQGRNIIVADLSDSFELELEGKNKEKQKLGKEKTIDFYYSLIVENLLQDYAELREIFKDNKSLRDRVMQLASSSPTYGRDFAEAFSLDTAGKFVLSPNSPTIFRKVQQLVNSVIKNHIAVQKVDGAALIQASGIGLTDDLRLVYDEDGKLVGAECYLPATSRRFFEAFTKKKTVNGQEIEILDEEALRKAGLNEAIGYRIPTENKSSMLPIIIKGFAPQQNGSAIFLPAEITVLSGSDFDVDKMFVMLSSFFVSEYRMADARKDFAKTNDMFRGLISGLLKAGNIEALEEDELENIDEEAFKKWFEKNKESYRRSKPKIYKYQYDFSKSPKQNGRKARNTMLVQIMYNILTSQEGSESMFNPQNFEDLKEASKMMKIMQDPRLLRLYMEKNNLTIDNVGQALWNASKDDLIDFVKKNDVVRSPIYPQTFDYFHDQNMAGDALLAMFALQVSAAAKFQRADITIKPKHRFTINGREIKDVDRIMNGLGEHRLKNVSQFVGGCADNGKDPNVTDYGATKNNAKVVAYMLRAGLSIKEACLVINQPEMQLPLNKLAVEIGIKNRNAWPNNNVGSETLLKNILQPEEISPKERQDILVMCYKIKEQAGYLADLTSMSRADSPNGGMPETFAKARIYKYKVDLFNGRLNTYDFPFEHIDAAVSNDKINLKEDEDQIRQKLLSQKMSMLQAFYSLGVQSLDTLLSPYFFMLGDKFDNMVTKRILNNLPAEMSDAQKEQIIDALYNDFITYSLSGLPLFGDENDESTLKSKRDYYLKQFPSDFRSALASNAELRNAVGNVLTADRFNRVVLKDGGQLVKGQKEEIMRRIASLMYSDNELTRNIAKDLLIYSFFDNGLQFTKDSFSTMFSTQFLINVEGYNDRLNSIEDLLDDTFVDRFIDQFANNHPEIAVSTYKKIHNTDIVSSDKIIIDKHHNQNFDNPLESKLRPYPYINHEGKIYVLDHYDYDFITYVPMSRFGNSNKLYNSNMTLQQMVTEFPYTEIVKGESDEYGLDNWMNDLDFDPTIDPDYNNAIGTREPLNSQETKATPTLGSSSEESDSGVSDKYDNGKDQISGHMC